MRTRTKLLSAGAGILSIAALTIALQPAFAYQGDPTQKGPNYSPERHEQMEKAFESNNYTDWKNLMNGRGRVTQVVNEGNFARFAEAHRLAEQGKTDDAQKIRQELGLGNGKGSGQGKNFNGARGNRGAGCPYNNSSN